MDSKVSVELAEAKELLAKFHKMFPSLADWRKENERKARKLNKSDKPCKGYIVNVYEQPDGVTYRADIYKRYGLQFVSSLEGAAMPLGEQIGRCIMDDVNGE